jgi:hypothetical protein
METALSDKELSLGLEFQIISALPLRPRRLRGELSSQKIHRRGAESAEVAQRIGKDIPNNRT